jgi:RNA polymerase sigma-54 factor
MLVATDREKVSRDKAVILAGNILRQFDALTNKHYGKIINKYDIEEEDLKDA